MKTFGKFVIAFGVFFLLYAMFMDVSVWGTVNLDLMNTRTNFTILGGLMVVAGLMMVLLGKPGNLIKCPHCAEDIIRGAVKCKHCGGEIVYTKPKEITYLDGTGLTESDFVMNAHGGGQMLNDLSVLKLAQWMHEKNPGSTALATAMRHSMLRQAIRHSMSIELGEQFDAALDAALKSLKA